MVNYVIISLNQKNARNRQYDAFPQLVYKRLGDVVGPHSLNQKYKKISISLDEKIELFCAYLMIR